MEKSEQQLAEQAEAEWEAFGDMLWGILHGKDGVELAGNQNGDL